MLVECSIFEPIDRHPKPVELTVNQWIRKSLDRQLGFDEPITIEQVWTHVRTRRSDRFDAARNARIAVGFVRYESIRGRAPDYLRRAKVCLELYERTGNLEFLVDVANFVEMEFLNPSQEGTSLEPSDHCQDQYHHDR